MVGSSELNDQSLELISFNLDLSSNNVSNLNLQLPSTILSTSLIVEDKIYIEVEGLLSIDRYVSSNLSVFAQFQSWSENQYWPNATDVAVPLNPQCDGNAVLFDGQLGNWCSYDQGILRIWCDHCRNH